MASYTLMQFIDTWMLAHATRAQGVVAPTAAANAGILGFALISLGMGVMFVVNTLVSQSFGRRDYAAAGQFLWQGIWFGVLFAAALLPLVVVAPSVFHWLGHEPVIAGMEATFLRLTLGAAVLKLVATALEQFFLGVNRPRAVAVATIGGVSVNALAAWMLIMGGLGVTPMGVAGSAIAQNIGVGAEMLIAIAFACAPVVRRTYLLSDWRLRPDEMTTLLKVGVPAGLQVIADVLAWSVFSMWVMGQFHNTAMAANIFVFRYMSVSFMLGFGISVAVTALVGRYIGMGRPDIAVRRAHLGFAVTGSYMFACGLFFFVCRRQLIGLFADDPAVIRIGSTLLVFAAVYQLFDAMYIVYNGALRGAGDTFVPAIVLAVLCWSITVFGGYMVAVTRPGLGPTGPWVAATTYGITLGVFMLIRFMRGGWKQIRLQTDSQPSNLNLDSSTFSVAK
jgi:MATE family multidrug resistance protein